MTLRSSKSETKILPPLILKMFVRQIRARGDDTFRIRQKRTHGNYDNLTFRTNPILRELLAGKEDALSSEEAPINNPGNDPRDDGCGRAA